MTASGAAYFISDAHLGAARRELEASREAKLHEFLKSLPGRASSLFIVGDLFDFWFEYGSAIPRRHAETVATLKQVREAGVDITLMNGNHDFYLGPFLRNEVGLHTHDGALAVELQGRKIWLHHGDGLLGGDLGYKMLKKVLRSPISIGLYRLIHPDIGIPLAHWCSNASRRSRPDKPLEEAKLWRDIGLPRFAEGFDCVMVGHFHQVMERHEAGRDFFVLGDWMEHFTYVVLEQGRFRLERYAT